MTAQLNSTRVQAPDFRLPVTDAPGNRTYDGTSIKLTRGVFDVAEEKVSILRPKITLSVGTWNVRTIMDDYAVKLLVRELSRYRCDIVGIAETHRLGTEEMEEDGYKVVTSGNEAGDHRRGVVLVLSKTAQKALIGYNPISERIIMARFQAFIGELIVIQVYAPTADSSDKDINEFYDVLQMTMATLPSKACVVLMGDFNAKVGDSECAANSVIGKFGYGNSNARGEQLLNFCGINDLVIANTLFKQGKESRSWTWESPDGRTHNQIDYVMVSRKWRSSIMNARAYPSADVGSDHQLVIANLKLKLKRQLVQKPIRRFDVSKLKNPQTNTQYEITVGGRFAALLETDIEEEGVDKTWTAIKEVFNSSSADILGTVRHHKTREWLTDKTRQMSDERRILKPKKRDSAENTRHYNYLSREIRKCGRADKEEYLNEICRKVEEANVQNKSRAVYQSVRHITNKKESRVRAIKTTDGVTITDPKGVKDRWKEHFDQLYNVKVTADPSVLQDLPTISHSDDTPKLQRVEVEAAIQKMKDGKSPGVDNVTADEMKAAGSMGVNMMFKLCERVWEREEIPEDWSKAVIVPIYKKKDKTVCDNYRGISLLCHAEKLFASIILQRIRNRTEEILTESQAGFRRGRSTIDQLFTLRLLMEKYSEF
jgi:hypothetical protein